MTEEDLTRIKKRAKFADYFEEEAERLERLATAYEEECSLAKEELTKAKDTIELQKEEAKRLEKLIRDPRGQNENLRRKLQKRWRREPEFPGRSQTLCATG